MSGTEIDLGNVGVDDGGVGIDDCGSGLWLLERKAASVSELKRYPRWAWA